MPARLLRDHRPNDTRSLVASREGIHSMYSVLAYQGVASPTWRTPPRHPLAQCRSRPTGAEDAVDDVIECLSDQLSRLPEDDERLTCRTLCKNWLGLWAAVDRRCRARVDELAVHLKSGARPYEVYELLPSRLRDRVYVALALLDCMIDDLPAVGGVYPGLLYYALGPDANAAVE